MRNQRWQPRNGCDGRLMAKILITTIQANLVQNPRKRQQNSTELLLLKFLPLICHFLAATFDFTFFYPGFFGGRTLLLQLVLIRL